MTGFPQLLHGAHIAVLTTIDPDGTPQSSPVWYGLEGADVVVSTTAGRRKASNVARDPRVSLVVWDPADPSTYVEIRGTAAVEPDPTHSLAITLGERYGMAYGEPAPDVVRVILRITPTRIAQR